MANAKLAELYVEVSANSKKLDVELAKSRSKLMAFGAFAKKQASSVSLGGLTSAGKIGGVGVAGAAAGIGAGLYAAAIKAADLGESISKVKVTFGSASGAMLKQADDLASKFGVVKREVLDAASGFGLMGIAAGQTGAAAGKMGQDFVKLGLDLASYHNISNQEAFEKLRAGLAGEAEPLRPLGIMLSEDAVKAEALAIGLVKVKRQLTEQEKIIARTSLIKKQAGPAVGDLSRTSDSNANQLKNLKGQLENAITDFGAGLSDALTDGIKLAKELGAILKDAAGPSFGKDVADLTRGSINAIRTGIGQDGGKFAFMSIMQGMMNMGGMGGGDAGKTGQRLMEEMVQKHVGGQFEADGIPWMMTQAGANQGKNLGAAAEKRAAQQKAMLNQRDAQDELGDWDQHNEKRRISRLRDSRNKEAIKDVGTGIGKNLASSIQGALKAFSLNDAVAAAGRKQIAANDVLGGGGGGMRLLQGALGLAHVMAKEIERDKPVYQSEHINDIEDYSRQAIQNALNMGNPTEEKLAQQIMQLQTANEKLGVIADGVTEVAINMGKNLFGGLFPK